ncbi:MAG: NAD(P)H-binding protein [Planctomycetota bacterium]
MLAEQGSPVVVFGATGRTGLAFLERARLAGTPVRAVVRDAARLGRFADDPLVESSRAAIDDPNAIASVLAGASAVVSCLGPKGTDPQGLYTRAFAAIAEGMKMAGLRRLLVVTSSGHETDPTFPLFFRAFVKPIILKKLYANMADAEKVIEACDLDWTIVRPSMFVAHRIGEPYRVREGLNPEGGWKISREHAAEFMLRELGENAWVGGHPALAY